MEFYLIAGLGNPGGKYDKTKHNVGYRIVEELARKHGESFKDFEKVGKVAAVKSGKIGFLLYKPTTFMNLSGESILKIMDYFNIATENLLIIHDEMGMQPGIVKYSLGGGANGHNGVENVIRMMQSKDFMRVKFGVGRPQKPGSEKHVLSPFPKPAVKFIDARIRNTAKALKEYTEHHDFVKLQNDHNAKATL